MCVYIPTIRVHLAFILIKYRVIYVFFFRSSASLLLNRCNRLPHSITHKSLVISNISSFLWIDFSVLDKEGISDGFMAHFRVLRGGGGSILSYF